MKDPDELPPSANRASCSGLPEQDARIADGGLEFGAPARPEGGLESPATFLTKTIYLQ